MKKWTILSLVFAGSMLSVSAQQLPLYSQYFFTPQITNPAQAGAKGFGELATMHRQQWMGMEGAPETSMLAYNSALNKEKIGYGIYAFNDVTDIVRRSGIYGSYSYTVSLAEKTSLRFGAAVGYLNNTIDMASIRVKNADDPFLFPANNDGTLDLNLGIHLQADKFGLGFSAPQLLAPAITYSTNYTGPIAYHLIRHYSAQAQYDVTIQKDKMTLSPLVVVRAAGLAVPVQIDAGAMFNMREFGFIGATYRSNYAVSVQAGVHLTPLLTVGYAQDFSTNTYSTSLGMTNEFMLAYRFGNNKAAERMEAELKRLKDQQKKQLDQQESFINEKFEEFKEEVNAAQKQELERQKQILMAEKAKATQAAAEQAKKAQAAADKAGRNASLSGANQDGNSVVSSGSVLEGYNTENLATNVAPGSPGFYITTGVFSTQENAEKLQKTLGKKGLDSKLFQDKGNRMFYVYVLKFKTYEEADKAKSTKLNGRFDGKLWVKVVE